MTKPQKIEGGKKCNHKERIKAYLKDGKTKYICCNCRRVVKRIDGVTFDSVIIDEYFSTPHVSDCICDECTRFIKDKTGLSKEDILALKEFQGERVARKQVVSESDVHINFCDRCGRKIVPLKTVNNSGQPTYWAGCMHGTKDCGNFTWGVKQELYELAIKMVLDDSEFGMSYEDKKYSFDYAWENAIYRACDKLKAIESLKVNGARYTKEKLIEDFKKYFKND